MKTNWKTAQWATQAKNDESTTKPGKLSRRTENIDQAIGINSLRSRDKFSPLLAAHKSCTIQNTFYYSSPFRRLSQPVPSVELWIVVWRRHDLFLCRFQCLPQYAGLFCLLAMCVCVSHAGSSVCWGECVQPVAWTVNGFTSVCEHPMKLANRCKKRQRMITTLSTDRYTAVNICCCINIQPNAIEQWVIGISDPVSAVTDASIELACYLIHLRHASHISVAVKFCFYFLYLINVMQSAV